MPTEIIMPALGMSQETGRLVAWLKNAGDTVRRGEPLMEVETDKTTVEVEAAGDGILAKIMANAGDEVPVGQVIALLLAPGETVEEPVRPPQTSGAAPPPRPQSAAASITPVAKRVAAAYGVDVDQIPARTHRVTRSDVEAFVNGQAGVPPTLVPASPKARRLAREQGIDLSQISGSGPAGAVLAADVQRHTPPPPPEATSDTSLPTQVSQLWRRMAERLTESWQTIPHFYLRREVTAGALVTWRQGILSRSAVKITYTDLLLRLIAAALRQHPHLNSEWTGGDIRFHDRVNIGLAVAVEDGLLVPVIHDADTLGIVALARRRQELVERATAGKLKPADLLEGTFTFSNLGMYGVDEFSAIVNPPQAAILAAGRIAERVTAVDGQAVVRPMLTLSLSCDHRAVDGARAAQFLDTLAKLIEDPLCLMD